MLPEYHHVLGTQ